MLWLSLGSCQGAPVGAAHLTSGRPQNAKNAVGALSVP